MCELFITKGQSFTVDGDKVYRMTIDQKDILNSSEYHTYHTFYYKPETNMFSNANCFYVIGKKIFELEELQNIWQPSIRAMMLRHRTKENETLRDFIFPLADHETDEKMIETYLVQVENAWTNAK
jgi:hypothetical protein